jgi:hypothetical protein
MRAETTRPYLGFLCIRPRCSGNNSLRYDGRPLGVQPNLEFRWPNGRRRSHPFSAGMNRPAVLKADLGGPGSSYSGIWVKLVASDVKSRQHRPGGLPKVTKSFFRGICSIRNAQHGSCTQRGLSGAVGKYVPVFHQSQRSHPIRVICQRCADVDDQRFHCLWGS